MSLINLAISHEQFHGISRGCCFFKKFVSTEEFLFFSYLFTWTLLCTLRDTIPEGSKESEMNNLELSYFHFYHALCLPWYFVNLEDFQEHSKFRGDIWKPWDNKEKDAIKGSAVQPQTAFISPWRWWQVESPRQMELGGDTPENKPADQWGWGASLLHSQRQGKHLEAKLGFFPVLYLNNIWLCVISEASNSLPFACIHMCFTSLPAQHFFIWTCE